MQQVAARLGWSKSKVSRLERGLSPRVTVEDLVVLGSVVGLRASLQYFPLGRPIRDVGQIELLAALTQRMHPTWRHRHEVPMPIAGDLRAADQVSSIPGCRLMVEAYRRFVDAQAQTRSARMKQRDLGAERLVILVDDTRANRRAIAPVLPELRRSFPVSARKLMAALAAGKDPGGDAIVLMRRTSLRDARQATRGRSVAASDTMQT